MLALPLLAVLVFLFPGPLDEWGLLLILLFLAGAKSESSRFSIQNHKGFGCSDDDYSSSCFSTEDSYDSYVLNKRTGVIHERLDSSVDSISERNRKSLSYSEAQDLVDRGTKYRFKQDP